MGREVSLQLGSLLKIYWMEFGHFYIIIWQTNCSLHALAIEIAAVPQRIVKDVKITQHVLLHKDLKSADLAERMYNKNVRISHKQSNYADVKLDTWIFLAGEAHPLGVNTTISMTLTWLGQSWNSQLFVFRWSKFGFGQIFLSFIWHSLRIS